MRWAWDRDRACALHQLLHINVQQVRGELVFKAQRLVHHSTLGLRAITKKKMRTARCRAHGGREADVQEVWQIGIGVSATGVACLQRHLLVMRRGGI